MSSFEYSFSAVKGIQAGREYYIAMLPLGYLSKIFSSDQEMEYLPPEYRAQRILNESRIPEIATYIIQNRNSYVFSSLSASIKGQIKFETVSKDSNIGTLTIPMSATFLINDGQHRKAAILRAIREDPSLENETISVVFFMDEGIERAQQMFTDLNKHAVKTSKSLSTLYDNRNELAKATLDVIKKCEFLNSYTDLEKDNLGINSSNFFTLANLNNANKRILKSENCSEDDLKFLIKYWNYISSNITEWNEVLSKDLTKRDLRENYILTLGVTISALGKLGNYFYCNPDIDMKKTLSGLSRINWKRNCKENWENRTIRPDGKISNNENSISLTCSKIKSLLGIPLTEEEQEKEKSLGE